MDCVGGVPIEPAPKAKGKANAGRVHRLKALGNAVVPQVVEVFGKVILRLDEQIRAAQAAGG
jgi:hypothetical protein